jgi:hypothetical protein
LSLSAFSNSPSCQPLYFGSPSLQRSDTEVGRGRDLGQPLSWTTKAEAKSRETVAPGTRRPLLGAGSPDGAASSPVPGAEIRGDPA